MNGLLTNLLYFGVSLYLLYLWVQDYQKQKKAQSILPQTLPGATPASRNIILIGIAGALFLLLLETAGEIGLGLDQQQTTLPWAMLFSLIAASIIEEIIFRGYCIVDGRGPGLLWLSAIGFSLLFVLIHPYLWIIGGDQGLKIPGIPSIALSLTEKTLFTSLFLFLSSLWFYWLRFNRWNPRKSLLPCFAAHLVGNLSVFFIKWAQGFIEF